MSVASGAVRRTLARGAANGFALAAGATMLGAAFAGPVSAAPVTFDFDNMGSGGSTSQGLSSASISNWMTSVLGSAVTVTGAKGQQGTLGYSGSSGYGYAGEGYVVGPPNDGSSKPKPLTLGDTEGAYPSSNNGLSMPIESVADSKGDGFLKNCTLGECGSSNNSPDIFIDFHGLEIATISFDFEIFPDGTCTKLDTTYYRYGHLVSTTTCGGYNVNLPDFELWSDDGGTGMQLLGPSGTAFATGIAYGVAPGTSNTYSYSINSYGSGGSGKKKETAPQLLSVSGTIDVSALNISTLDFMDWPETIGIDNLVITFKDAPEPMSIAMFGLGLVGLAGMAWRKRARALPSA